jgi:tetratricopeptide (TPR) repeat protein
MELPIREKIGPAHYIVISLTVLAPVMAGCTTVWARAAITICTGLLFLLFPARRSLGLYPNLAMAGLLALALFAFLPARWFPVPTWRSELAKLGAQLPATITAQPWLTLESALVLLLGLSWTYYLMGLDWNWDARRKTWVSVAAAIVALAGALTASFLLKKRIPFWPDVPEFGFFPNRNQTSNVLGLGGILVYALALRGFEEGRKNWWVWLAALSLICSALILNYSRSGIILLCGGVLAWHLYWLIRSEQKRRPLIASGAILLLLALLAWSGGKTAMRFSREETAKFFSLSQNGRFPIYRDAVDFSLKSPLAGIGLNNFGAVFTTNQHFSAGPDIAVHPESDWIWSAVELGWFAPLLIGLLFCWWAARCFPFDPGTFRLMRMAGFICGCGFALHAFFDVPGHRIGALWPALLIATTAIHPKVGYRHSQVIPIAFQLFGIIFIAVGTWWFASIRGANVLPTIATLERSFQEIESASESEDYRAMLERASKALKIAPLNWELYFKRGFAEAALYHPRTETLRDFAAARYLLPYWPDLYLKEGEVWLGVGDPDLAFEVWEEGMRRCPDSAPAIYSEMFGAIKGDADLRDRWRQLAQTNTKCFLIFLQNADPFEISIELERLLSEDSQLRSFTPAELKTLFSVWYARGDELALAETLRQHPEWQKIAWRELARVYAEHQDYRQAYETVARFSARPRLPDTDPGDSIESLARRFRISGNIENDGLRLALAEANVGEVDDALALLKALSAMPDAPRSLHFLEGDVWARKGEWQKAWQAISQYEPGLR